MSIMHIELPIGAFIGATIVLVPLPWHWRARNIATLSIIAWLFISNAIYGINSIIWMGNVANVAPIWCDISTKLQVGSNMSLPACCLCLCIHLERIASSRNPSNTYKDKRRRMIFDGVLCWGIPIIYMALHYVVQGHRFDIIEHFGCRPAIFNSIQSILLFWLPPLIVVALTIIYAALALHHFFVRRITFARHLQDTSSALTTSRYFRLIAMAIVQMFWGAFVLSVNMWFTCSVGLRKWISWDDVHSNFGRVAQFPAAFIPPFILKFTFLMWWTIPASSLLFFVFFAFGQDALKEYSECFRWVSRLVVRRDPKATTVQCKELNPSSTRFPRRFQLPSFRSSPVCDLSKTAVSEDGTATHVGDTDSIYKPTSPRSTTSFAFTDRTCLSTDLSGSTMPPSPCYCHKENVV